MTGPEHYREAERLANQANHFTYGDGADPVTGHALAAEAQVHATLALTAATVATRGIGPEQGNGWREVSVDADTWREVAQ